MRDGCCMESSPEVECIMFTDALGLAAYTCYLILLEFYDSHQQCLSEIWNSFVCQGLLTHTNR